MKKSELKKIFAELETILVLPTLPSTVENYFEYYAEYTTEFDSPSSGRTFSADLDKSYREANLNLNLEDLEETFIVAEKHPEGIIIIVDTNSDIFCLTAEEFVEKFGE